MGLAAPRPKATPAGRTAPSARCRAAAPGVWRPAWAARMLAQQRRKQPTRCLAHSPRRDGCREGVADLLIACQTNTPNSYRFINRSTGHWRKLLTDVAFTTVA